jgi:hypothetical protein
MNCKKIDLIKIKTFCFYFFVLLSTNCFSQKIVYKGNKGSVISDSFTLDFKDSTYVYRERSTSEGDLRYDYLSQGKFIVDKDTLTLVSNMPNNKDLPWIVNNLTSSEIEKYKFSYIYPVNDNVKNGFIKIYFDNIANPQDYKVYTFEKDKLVSIKINSFVKLKNDSILKTEKSEIRLFHYIVVKKPKNNKLIIIPATDGNISESYFFDFDKIPYNSFHFYTRVYSSYYDFTGLKFIILKDSIKRFFENDNRYKHGEISNTFDRQ